MTPTVLGEAKKQFLG